MSEREIWRLRFDTLAAIWRGLAVTTLNSVVLVAVVLGAIAAVSAWRHRDRAGFSETYSSAFNPSTYRFLPAEEALALGREFDRMGEHQSFEFNPWTSFMVGSFKGERLNVEAAPVLNHRRTPQPADNGKPELLVWAFGGSTLFGWGLSDDATVPARLQSALQNHLPERRVRVINYGQPYWFSSVELAILPALLRRQPKPDIALFLGGLNDTVWGLAGVDAPPLSNRAKDAWDRAKADVRRELPWISINSSSPIARLEEALRMVRLLPYSPAPSHPFRQDVKDAPHYVAATYAANRAMISALAAQAGFTPVFVLQPVPFWGDYGQPSPGQGVNMPSGTSAIYRAIAAESSDPRFHDLSQVLADVPLPYVDSAHYSDLGAQVLAERVAEVLAMQAR